MFSRFGAVSIGAEHVRCHEARAREIAFVAEDAVELQRMSDRFMDLQHHLIGREQHIHSPRRAVGGREQLERFVGDAASAAGKAESGQDFGSALLADAALTVERALLRDAIRMRRYADRRIQEPVTLQHVAAFACDEPVCRMPHVDQRFPVDDARIPAGVIRFAVQELIPFPPRRQCRVERWRCIVATRRGPRQ